MIVNPRRGRPMRQITRMYRKNGAGALSSRCRYAPSYIFMAALMSAVAKRVRENPRPSELCVRQRGANPRSHRLTHRAAG